MKKESGKYRLIQLFFVAAASALALTACGSGGSAAPAAATTTPPPPASYTVGGAVTGLVGSVVLQDNGGDNLTVKANGAFTFATKIANGGAYKTTVLTQPTGQTCSVSTGAGTVSGNNVTNVAVVCSTNTYSVGGNVTGLKGSLVLQDNLGDNLTVAANSAFTFATKVANGSPYSVTVLTQPVGQSCSIASGTGTITATNVANVAISCATNTYTIGGTVTGLNGSMVLQDNGADNLTVATNGTFSFATAVANGNPYSVTVLTQPTAQICSVASGSGTTSLAAVGNIAVSCVGSVQGPTGISITGGNAQATLSWQAMTGATSYNVYYKTTTGVTTANSTKITNTTSGTAVTGLTNGTAYYFVVTAIRNGVETAVSSEVGTVPQATVAGIASGLTVSSGIGQVTLSWTAVTGATSYNVYYGTTAGVTPANGTKVTGATSGGAIAGLTSGTKYYFVVTAMSSLIENSASTWVSAIPQSIANLMGGAIQTPLTLTGTVSTVTTSAPLSIFLTFGLATDGTNLYVSTWYSYKKINIVTGLVTPFAGAVNSNAITTEGNDLYVAGYATNSLSKAGLISGLETSVTGAACLGCANTVGSIDGAATAAQFSAPQGITTDGKNLYVADSANSTIRKVVIATGVVSTLAGSPGLIGTTDGIGSLARFNFPNGITTDGTNLYVSDTNNNLIRKVVIADGTVTTIAGGFAGLTWDGTGVGAKFNGPWGITTDGTNLYVVDYLAHTVRKVVIASGVVTTIAGNAGVAGNVNGAGSSALFNNPVSITTDGKSLYVGDFTNGVIRKIQ